MLIQSPTGVKNPYWKDGITPNEALEQNPRYAKLVELFKRYNRIKSPSRFLEVRVINQSPLVEATGQVKWWNDSLFMEKVFWVFQSPTADQIDGAPYPYYVLEPYECQWVINLGASKYGQIPVNDLKAAFFVPVECCQHAWRETSGGVSDHIRYRPKIEPTQEEIDKKANTEREGKRFLDSAIDAANDPRFEKMYDVLEKTMRTGK